MDDSLAANARQKKDREGEREQAIGTRSGGIPLPPQSVTFILSVVFESLDGAVLAALSLTTPKGKGGV